MTQQGFLNGYITAVARRSFQLVTLAYLLRKRFVVFFFLQISVGQGQRHKFYDVWTGNMDRGN
jgi:hypothetical protein